MKIRWVLAILPLLVGSIALLLFIEQPTTREYRISPEATVSSYVFEYGLPNSDSGPMAITTDKLGKVWIGLGGIPGKSNVSVLAQFDPSKLTLLEYQIPEVRGAAQIWGLISRDDGTIWFGEAKTNGIWEFNTTSLKFRKFPIPTPNAFPVQIAFGNSGKVWFTEVFANKIAVLDPTTGEIQEFAAPGPEATPVGLAFDADGRLWVTLARGKDPGIAVFDPKTNQFTEYKPPATIFLPTGIFVDSSKAIWFTQHFGTSKVSRYSVQQNELVDYVASPSAVHPDGIALPYWISADRSGAIWFNEHFANRIAKLNPETGELIEYEIPADRIVNAVSFALDPADNIWFVEWTENKFGMIDTSVPIPFELGVRPSRVILEGGQETSISLFATGHSSSRLRFSVLASTDPVGQLVNLTASVNPPELSLEDGKTVEAILTLIADSDLQPGTYTLTVLAKESYVSVSVIIELNVVA